MLNSRNFLFISSLAVLILAGAGCNGQIAENPNNASSSPLTVQVSVNPQLGRIFTDGTGMTLYIFTKDTKNSSTCYAACAQKWPPVVVNNSPRVANNLITSKFGTITRTDGTKQVTYEGAPLYYWYQDQKPGDTKGQGIGNVWYVYKVSNDDLNTSSPK